MRNIIGFAIGAGLVFLLLSIILVQSLDGFANSRAQLAEAQGRAQAMVIEAQGQARLDTATAAAVTTNALIPWVVLAMVGCFGSVVLVVAIAGRSTPALSPDRESGRLTERYIFFLPQAQRRQTYRQIEGYMQGALPETSEIERR